MLDKITVKNVENTGRLNARGKLSLFLSGFVLFIVVYAKANIEREMLEVW